MMTMTATAYANDTVSAIEFHGLNRVTPQSLQVVLPLGVGQTLTADALADSIRALYATEQFSHVQANVDGGHVVFYVAERPIIAELNFDGNKLIAKDGLKQGLEGAGLAVGNVLKQATVQTLESELENQYISQGYYNADITVKQTKLDGNRVKLDIHFVEGKPARVVDINII